MALTLTQVAVTTAATPLVTIPPGSSVTLLASAATAVGTSNAVTTGTGFLLPANVPVPLTLTDSSEESATELFGITASTANVSVALST